MNGFVSGQIKINKLSMTNNVKIVLVTVLSTSVIVGVLSAGVAKGLGEEETATVANNGTLIVSNPNPEQVVLTEAEIDDKINDLKVYRDNLASKIAIFQVELPLAEAELVKYQGYKEQLSH